MHSTLKLYLDLCRASLRMARRHYACGYAASGDKYVADARHWLAQYWSARPR